MQASILTLLRAGGPATALELSGLVGAETGVRPILRSLFALQRAGVVRRAGDRWTIRA